MMRGSDIIVPVPKRPGADLLEDVQRRLSGQRLISPQADSVPAAPIGKQTRELLSDFVEKRLNMPPSRSPRPEKEAAAADKSPGSTPGSKVLLALLEQRLGKQAANIEKTSSPTMPLLPPPSHYLTRLSNSPPKASAPAPDAIPLTSPERLLDITTSWLSYAQRSRREKISSEDTETISSLRWRSAFESMRRSESKTPEQIAQLLAALHTHPSFADMDAALLDKVCLPCPRRDAPSRPTARVLVIPLTRTRVLLSCRIVRHHSSLHTDRPLHAYSQCDGGRGSHSRG